MKKVKGDLLELALDGEFDVIVHGCNCFCLMGAGIAKSIKTMFPEAYFADLNTQKGDRGKLGTCSMAMISVSISDNSSGISSSNNGERLLAVVNGYTQYHWKGAGILADYDAIKAVFERVKKDFSGKRIGYPKIGAGLARGNWNVIASIIDKALEGEDHTLVEFSP